MDDDEGDDQPWAQLADCEGGASLEGRRPATTQGHRSWDFAVARASSAERMASNATLAMGLAVYLGVFAVLVYVFLIADPETSGLARFVTETLPNQFWKWIERRLSARTVSTLAFFADRLLLVVYCAVVYGAWSLVFWLVYPWISRSPSVSDAHQLGGYLFFLAGIASWRLAGTTSPGVITADSLARYDHFPHDGHLFEANRRCRTTGLPKPARSKFDRYRYNANVPRFDHYCGWVHNTIGEENYRWFLLFLLVHAAMCAYGTLVLGWLFLGEVRDRRLLEATYVDRHTGEEIGASASIVVQYLFNRYLWEVGVFMLMAVMSVALLLFLVYHVYLTSCGMTTNESYKWGYVRKWYKEELKRYDQAVAFEAAAPSPASDGKSSDGGQERKREDEIQHPGPPPVNIYDRGFIENWKEVIYPISLRRDQLVSKAPKHKAA